MSCVSLRWCAPVLSVLVVAAACERNKSYNPLSPTVAGPIAGVSIDPPTPKTPSASTQIAVDQQPITLTIENAKTNGVRPVSYIFEIGADSNFATKVFTQTGVVPGEDGRTSLKLSQNLPPEKTYYWHAKADDGANASEYSETLSFLVYTPIVIQAPSLREPGDAEQVTTRKPTFTVTNAQRSGPAGAIQYLFEVATTASFSNKVISVLVNEGSAQTSHTATSDLAYDAVYYWRVKAMDPGHEGPFSSIRSFQTPPAPVIVNPTPAPGLSGPAAQDSVDIAHAVIHNSPLDVGSWPITSKIEGLDMTSQGTHVDFSKSSGGDRWPDVYPAGWDEPLQYTLGMCLNISSQWHCSAPIQFWYGLWRSGGPPQDVAHNWFYDSFRWGVMAGHQPAVGETVGIFVCSGNCRNTTSGNDGPVRERTNVVTIPFPSGSGGSWRF